MLEFKSGETVFLSGGTELTMFAEQISGELLRLWLFKKMMSLDILESLEQIEDISDFISVDWLDI